MSTIKTLERLRQLHLLIDQETTGAPFELAQRMHISERLVYHLIEQLRDYNAPIKYDRSRKTYYYYDDFEFQVNISVSIVSHNEATKIFGGHALKSHLKDQLLQRANNI